MSRILFITHPEVAIDPAVPVPQWRLSPEGMTRMRRFAVSADLPPLQALYCSAERKARDGAAILAEATGLAPTVREDLGENDRSATGYLPKAAFEAMADRFFAAPETSVEGWEGAIDAQRRIVGAIGAIDAEVADQESIAIVAHGGVGALLLAHLLGQPISRALDQPGGGGGCVLDIARRPLRLTRGWRTLEALLSS